MNLLYEKIEEYLNKYDKNNAMLSLYIDTPFCRSNCTYCIYKSLEFNEAQLKEYEKVLVERLLSFDTLFDKYPVDTLYLGGGTPSLLSYGTLSKIKDAIPHYNKIKTIKTEAHPSDMNSERIDFYANEMNINVVSLGVQSFNHDSCLKQKRIFVSEDEVAQIVNKLKKKNIWVNIDLVALFGGDTENDWNIFENDIKIACETVVPDVITCVPNYRTKMDYIEQLVRFRQILRDECNKTKYCSPSDIMLSLEYSDRVKYGKNDHWIGTTEYWKYFRSNKRYSCSGPKSGINNNQITIAIGGAEKHKIYSYTPAGNIIYSHYSFEQKEFIDEIN